MSAIAGTYNSEKTTILETISLCNEYFNLLIKKVQRIVVICNKIYLYKHIIMNNLNFKNELLKELVSKKSLGRNELLEILGDNQETLNIIAKEFQMYGYSKSIFTDQVGVISMNITYDGELKYKNGGF